MLDAIPHHNRTSNICFLQFISRKIMILTRGGDRSGYRKIYYPLASIAASWGVECRSASGWHFKGLTGRQSPSSIDCKEILMPDRSLRSLQRRWKSEKTVAANQFIEAIVLRKRMIAIMRRCYRVHLVLKELVRRWKIRTGMRVQFS